MGKKFDFQYLVLGGGEAGSTVALTLAKMKKKVAIIDNRMAKKNAKKFIDSGVVVILGCSQIKDSHSIEVSNQVFSAEFLIIATGRSMDASKIEGLSSIKYRLAPNVTRMRKMPATALVIGGGADGCRAAERLAQGGTKVVIAEKTSRLMSNEDTEISGVFRDYFEQNPNVVILTGTEVTHVAYDKDKNVTARFISGRTEHEVKVNLVILATEKNPVVNIGLEKAGVKYSKNGINVDRFLQTNVKNIYAIGGAIGKDDSREYDNYAGIVLGRNLATKSKNLFNYRGFAKIIKTFPEVAIIGASETDLKIKKTKYRKAVIRLEETEAGERTDFKYGFVKILVNKQGEILGAIIVSPGASAMIQELVLAVRQHLTIAQIAGTPHPLGEFGIAIKMAAKKLAVKSNSHKKTKIRAKLGGQR